MRTRIFTVGTLLYVLLSFSVSYSAIGWAENAPVSELLGATNAALNTITVNSTVDVSADDGQCTLREAITAANSDTPSGTQTGECVAGVGEDLIIIPAGEYLLSRVGANEDNNLTGDLDVRTRITLRGAGANQTILNGNGTDRVIQSTSDRFIIEDLSVVNGATPPVGFINGGGIAHLGPKASEFVLRRVSVRNNRTADASPQGHGGDGGGIYLDDASFTLEASEVSENSTGNMGGERAGYGGGIYGGSISGTIRMSTISNNHTAEQGIAGGVYLITANIAFDQVTIAENQVGSGTSGVGGGVYIYNSTTSLKGVLFAENLAGSAPNCFGFFPSQGGNLIDDPTDCNFTPTSGDQVNLASLIKELQDNGGTGTRTHALYDNSPALDHGSCDGSTTDQRGFPRPVDLPSVPNGNSTCDVGAFETQSLVLGTPTSTVTPSPTGTPTATPSRTLTPSITPTSTPLTRIKVNNTADIIANDGTCTLREAVMATRPDRVGVAQMGECPLGSAPFLIEIPPGTYVLSLVGPYETHNLTGDLNMTRSDIVMRGAGANQTIIDGNGTDRVIHAFETHLILEDLSIVNGYIEGERGGGIAHFGNPAASDNLILRRVAVRNNRAEKGGDGGGIHFYNGVLTVEMSEISNNYVGVSDTLQNGNGGGIYADNALSGSRIHLSTISGNHAAAGGAGVFLITSRIALSQSTIADNQVANGLVGLGGGIRNHSSILQQLQGVIVTGNRAGTGSDCSGNFQSQGGNLIGNTTGCSFNPIGDDQVNTNALLESLQDNGGFGTYTHALLDDSPAVDHGRCDINQTDQRGYPRPIDHPSIPGGSNACDSGAYELTTLAGTPTVTLTPSPVGTLTPTTTPTLGVPATPTSTPTPLPPADIVVTTTDDAIADDGTCSLREAITAANKDMPSGVLAGECAAGNGSDTILLPAGYYLLTRTGADEDANVTGDLDIASDIHLMGKGKNETQLNGNRLDRVLHVISGNSTVTISGVSVIGGKVPVDTPDEIRRSGGGILIINGIINISGVAMRFNEAGDGTIGGASGGYGGAIAQWGGVLTITDSDLSQNRGGVAQGSPQGFAGVGGGIFSDGSLTIVRTTISQNVAGRGIGTTPPNPEIYPASGGGIYSINYLYVRESTIAHNESYRGGGIWSNLFADLRNSTISGNDAGGQGGGIYSRGVLAMASVTIARNHAQNGGGLQLDTQATLGNVLLNGNYPQDCYGATIESEGYILTGDDSCEITGNSIGNQIRVGAQLFPLTDNGGATDTHALAPDSPARDAGNCFNLTTDQRGASRPSDLPDIPNVADGCDIGSYEEQAAPTMTPTTTMTPTATTTSPNGRQPLYLPLIQR